MIFLIPYGTDAPVYYWPYATIGLIVTNTLVFFLQVASSNYGEPFFLHFGVINPVQWLTSVFMHISFLHLLANMIFLWSFGLVVEGKVGWSWFLGIYLATGILESGIEQFLMLGQDGATIGASGAIAGLIAISCLWAPENEIHCKFGCVFMMRAFFTEVSISILMLTFWFVGVDMVFAFLGGLEPSSALFHTVGALTGGAIGWWMLVDRRVDCEGYDALTILKGRRGQATPTREQEADQVRREAQSRLDHQRAVDEGWSKVRGYLAAGHYEMALNRFNILKRTAPDAELTEKDWIQVINGLIKKRKHQLAIDAMQRYLAKFDTHRESILLNLALMQMRRERRPRKALQTIRELEPATLTDSQKRLMKKIISQSQQMIHLGQVEFSD